VSGLEPMRLVMGVSRNGRVGNGQRIDVEAIAVDAGADGSALISTTSIRCTRAISGQLKPGSAALRRASTGAKASGAANDTFGRRRLRAAHLKPSASCLKRAISEQPGFKARFSDTGEDVKVMGVREARKLP